MGEDDYDREPMKREKSMTEIKHERKPEFKREKSTPEFNTHRNRDDRNRNNRNSREKDDESFQTRKGRGRGTAPVRGVTRGGKSVMIEDFPSLPHKDDDEDDYDREPMKR